jgi:NADPH:quinone reductase-like Zn-dependent oxidoreductase
MKAYALPDADHPAPVDSPQTEVALDGRIRVTAASVNGFDIFEATGNMVRFMEHRFLTIVGRDFSGVVDAVSPVSDVEVAMRASASSARCLAWMPAFAEFVRGRSRRGQAGRRPFTKAASCSRAAGLDAVDAVHQGRDMVPSSARLVAQAFAVQLAAQRGTVSRPPKPARTRRSFGVGTSETTTRAPTRRAVRE